MAMTIKSSPSTNTPANNRMWYVVDSTNKTQTNYKYILDLYVNGSVVATLNTRPYASNSNYGMLDVSNAVKQFIIPNYFVPTDSLVCGSVTGNKVQYQVVFSESYTSGSVTVVNSNQVSGSSSNAYNSVIPLEKLPTKTIDTYLNNFVTNRPSTVRCGADDKIFLNIFGGSPSYDTLEIKRYDANGTVLSTVTQSVSGDVLVNVSPSIVGATGSTTYYTTRLKRSGSYIGDTLTFNMSECYKYTQKNIHFMNALGGFDSIPFRLVSQKKRSMERKHFEQNNFELDASGNVIYYNSNRVFFEGKTLYGAQYKDVHILNSDPLTPDEFTWLAELVLSPMIFIEELIGGVTYYIPVVITANNYEFKDRQVEKQNILTIEVEYSVPQNHLYR